MRDQADGVGAPLVDTYSWLGFGKPPTWLLFVGIALVFLAIARAGVALGRRLSPPRELDREDTLAWLMVGAILYSMLIGGTFFGHYWLQIVPLSGLIFAHIIAAYRQYPVLYGLACSFVAVSFLAALASTARTAIGILTEPGFIENRAELRAAADRIEAVRGPNDTFWAAHRHLILWYLDAQQVSKAITHPSNIQRTSITRTLADAGYIAKDELQRIIDSAPTFIITGGGRNISYSRDKPEIIVGSSYVLFHESPTVSVYRLRDSSAIVD
jgi:hypothetical protein